MRARADARGHVELKGPTWWLRRTVEIVDPATGEVRVQRRRERIGPRTELRTRAAARAAADAWIEAQRPDVVMPGRQLLAIAWLEQFKRTHLRLMRPTSQAVYRGLLDKHLAPAAAGLRLRDLDSAWLKVLLAAKVRAGLAHATVQNIRGAALHLLRCALRAGYGAVRIDPREVRLPRQVNARHDRRYITAAELDRILEASPWPWRAVWALMGYGGLRIGEALGLEWEHIDFERRFISIRQSAVRGRLGAPKTETSRADVPILPELDRQLRDYQVTLIGRELMVQRVARVLGDPATVERPTGLLFRTRKGTAYFADDVRRRVLQPLLRSLGLAHAGHHAFRHGVPRMLAERGISGAVIQQVMRHGTLAQTEQYLHVEASDLWAHLDKAGLAGTKEAA